MGRVSSSQHPWDTSVVCCWGEGLAQAPDLRLCLSKKSTKSCHVARLSREFEDASNDRGIERGGKDAGGMREGDIAVTAVGNERCPSKGNDDYLMC